MSAFEDGEALARLAWIIFLSVVSIHFGVMCTLFYRRRHLKPISARRFPWAFGSLIIWWIYMFHPAIRFLWFGQPCVMSMVTAFFYYAGISCYFVRAWALWFKYNLTEQKQKFSNRIFQRSNSENFRLAQQWFIKNTKFTSDKFLLAAFAVASVALTAVTLIPLAITPNLAVAKFSDTDYSLWCPELDLWNHFTTGVIVFQCLVVLGVAFQFSRVRDGFFLKEELIFAGAFTLFQSLFIRLVSGFIPFDAPSPDIYPWGSFYRSIFSSVGRLILATVTGWYPIAKSFTMKQSTQPTRSPIDGSITVSKFSGEELRQYENLKSVLVSRSGRAAFRAHLKLEFSLENLMFWEAVEEYRDEFDSAQAQRNLELARKVVEKFILPDSILQVNMDWPTTRALFDAVALKYEYDGIIVTDKVYSDDSMELCLSIERSLFDVAQNKVVSLMASDSFVRFKNKRRRASMSMSVQYEELKFNFAENKRGDDAALSPVIEMASVDEEPSRSKHRRHPDHERVPSRGKMQTSPNGPTLLVDNLGSFSGSRKSVTHLNDISSLERRAARSKGHRRSLSAAQPLDRRGSLSKSRRSLPEMPSLDGHASRSKSHRKSLRGTPSFHGRASRSRSRSRSRRSLRDIPFLNRAPSRSRSKTPVNEMPLLDNGSSHEQSISSTSTHPLDSEPSGSHSRNEAPISSAPAAVELPSAPAPVELPSLESIDNSRRRDPSNSDKRSQSRSDVSDSRCTFQTPPRANSPTPVATPPTPAADIV